MEESTAYLCYAFHPALSLLTLFSLSTIASDLCQNNSSLLIVAFTTSVPRNFYTSMALIVATLHTHNSIYVIVSFLLLCRPSLKNLSFLVSSLWAPSSRCCAMACARVGERSVGASVSRVWHTCCRLEIESCVTERPQWTTRCSDLRQTEEARTPQAHAPLPRKADRGG